MIRARWIVPLHGPPVEGGWLRISRGRIVDLGAGPPPGHRDDASTIDAAGAIVIPGLVNAHTHLEFSDVDPPLDTAGGLPTWIQRVVALRRGRASGPAAEAQVAATIRRGLDESAAQGVTAIGEISTGIPVGGYPAGGPRVRVFREALGLSATSAMTAGAEAIRDVAHLLAAGVSAGISPHAPYSVAAPLATALIAAARSRSVPLAMHVAECEAEAELVRSGTGPFRDLFERLGVWPSGGPALHSAAEWISRLARGPRGVVVHGTHLDCDPDALARLARHRDRLCVGVCPRTTRALSGRLPPIGLFRGAGVRVAIGTDSRASTPDLSVLAECRTLVAAGVVSPEESLRMATVDAAWALGFERTCGILAPGRPADLAVLMPTVAHTDAYEAILDPATRIIATLRAGRVIAGSFACMSNTSDRP
ncbi:MAG: amidohydrolase family protein [Planctomycetes bacterium]|nr:amidohydrolase family protein [Planctomycetota bacterium]